jgi:putative transposase
MVYQTPLQPDTYYHIYNRGNNRENIFVNDIDYLRFIRLYIKHIDPVAETLAYCLMRNHFHLLVRIRKEEKAQSNPSRCFSNFFNAYVRSFNINHKRTGTLFQRPFKRIEITDDRYILTLIMYIHHNPQKHGFVSDFRDWSYSSYNSFISTQPTRIAKETVLSWFGGIDRFISAHAEYTYTYNIQQFLADDDIH